MSANLKVAVIVIIGVGACLMSIFASQYFHREERDNRMILYNIDNIALRIDHIRLLGRSFIQDADQTIWDQISLSMESVQENLRVVPHSDGHWRQEIEDLSRSLEDYHSIIKLLYEPAFDLKTEKEALQKIGLEFSHEVEEEIIKPYQKEEGLRIFKGESIDPFKSKAKDAAYDLVALHIKQQLILFELLLSSDLDAYKQQKEQLSTALARRKAKLKYMAILMGSEPSFQSVLSSLDQKLISLFEREYAIIKLFAALEGLNSRLIAASDKMLSVGKELASRITSDTLRTNRLNRLFNWSLLLGILGSLSVLGALLARNIIKFVEELKTSKQNIQESEERYRSFIEDAPIAMFTLNKEGEFTYANRKLLELTGYKIEDWLKKPFHPIVHPENLDIVIKRIQKRFEGRESNEPLEIRIFHSSGETRWARIISESIYDTDEMGIKRFIGVQSFLEDVTGEKLAEEALRESEEKHRKLVSNISDVIVILDNEGIITYKSPNITEQFGWSPDDLIGKHALFTVQHDDKERIGKELAQILKKDKAKVRVEYKYICKDGSNRPVELTAVNMVNDPVINGVLANFKDITERKYAEEILKQSEEKYRTMIERSNDMIWTLDTSGNFTFFNKQAEEVSGLKLKEWVGKSFVPLIIEEDLPRVMDIFKKGLRGKSAHYELRFRKQENEILTISVNTAPLLIDGTVIGIVSFGRDITEKKLAEEEKANLEAQLQRAQRMESIGTLAGGIAHDFNNILSAIIGYTELSLSEAEKNSTLYQNLQEVYRAGERAKDLVKQILTFSRQAEHERKPVQVKLIIKEVIKFLRASLPASIEIRQETKSESLVMADPTQIHQLLMNLCTNAGHAMGKKGGVLEVKLIDVKFEEDLAAEHPELKSGGYLELTIGDTGYGIPAHILDRIFDPFFTTKEKGEGTGMGLSVVHGIVGSYGGKVTVTSEPGKGSTFKVYLPTVERDDAPLPLAEEAIATGTERILFVDDETPLVNIGKQLLESLGYKITTRTSSIEALELFKSKADSFDLVITDMTMPNMTGDELARELIRIRPEIPVILCTGYSARINQQQVAAMGIRAFVSKPVLRRDIAATIRKVLGEK